MVCYAMRTDTVVLSETFRNVYVLPYLVQPSRPSGVQTTSICRVGYPCGGHTPRTVHADHHALAMRCEASGMQQMRAGRDGSVYTVLLAVA